MYNLERDIEILAGMYEDGATYEELSELLDLSCSRVKNTINTYIKERIKNDVLELYDKGLSHTSIAKELKITPNRTKLILAKNGRMTIDNLKRPELLELIVNDYKNGLSISEIRRKYKMSDNSILIYLGVAGVPIKSRTTDIDINERYFNTLNKDNIFDLGIMFSMCNVYNLSNSRKRVDLVTAKKFERYLTHIKDRLNTINTIYYKKVGNSANLSIHSNELSKVLLKYGLKDKFPTLDEELEYKFYDGYFRTSLRIRNSGIHIMFKGHNAYNLIQYLINIGIDEEDLMIENDALKIYKSDALERLIRTYPFIYDMVIDYTTENSWNTKWSNINVRFREQELDRTVSNY